MPVPHASDGPIGPLTTEATVFFADLRGYTRLAERLPARNVARLLVELFDLLVPAALGNGGVRAARRRAARACRTRWRQPAWSSSALRRWPPAGEVSPFLHLPQFALRGRAAPVDIWCVPAAERVFTAFWPVP